MVETVAVLDVGKSNVKLSLVDPARRVVIMSDTTPNRTATDGPYPHFDVDRIWSWLMGGLGAWSATRRIDTIVTTTHGACFVAVADGKAALPVLDYEFAGPQSVSGEYDALRGGFAETLSPALPNGLNAGRQLFWLGRSLPDAWSRVRSILPYPQYWAMRLSGAEVAEVTSLGSHTDLWNPRARTFSRLAESRGWAAMFPPVVPPWQSVGSVLPAVAREAGLPADCQVVAGIHDSNAALLPHLLDRPLPFTVLSTGTWMITFSLGGSLDRLDAQRDCLANVDAFGRPVPSAMCMAGREFEILTEGISVTPTLTDVRDVVATKVMALPSFVAGSGPYGRRRGTWSTEPNSLSAGSRMAAASLYAALVADTSLQLTGAAGPILVEGPFARNEVFLRALAQLAGRSVFGRTDAAGTTIGAALLSLGERAAAPVEGEAVAPLEVDLAAYAAEWRRRADGD